MSGKTLKNNITEMNIIFLETNELYQTLCFCNFLTYNVPTST